MATLEFNAYHLYTNRHASLCEFFLSSMDAYANIPNEVIVEVRVKNIFTTPNDDETTNNAKTFQTLTPIWHIQFQRIISSLVRSESINTEHSTNNSHLNEYIHTHTTTTHSKKTG